LSCPTHWDDQSNFFAGIQLKRSIHKEQLLAILLLMFEKEIILEEQLAARGLFQCSPTRKMATSAWHIADR